MMSEFVKSVEAYCCEYKRQVNGLQVGGDTIYPHRPDLYNKKFIKCPICGNYAKKYDGEYPVLPTEYIRTCRRKAHLALDKIWHSSKQKEKYYRYMSKYFGKSFHWGEVRDEKEADEALKITLNFLKEK